MEKNSRESTGSDSSNRNESKDVIEYSKNNLPKLEKEFKENGEKSDNNQVNIVFRPGCLVDFDCTMVYSAGNEHSVDATKEPVSEKEISERTEEPESSSDSKDGMPKYDQSEKSIEHQPKVIKQRFLESLPMEDAIKLVEAAEPECLEVQEADGEDARRIWDKVEPMFTKEIKKIYFAMVGVKESSKMNIEIICRFLPSIATKIANYAKRFIYVSISLTEFTILANGANEKEKPASISFTFPVDWEMRWKHRYLMAAIKQSIFVERKTIVLVLDLPCGSCIDHIFTHIGLKFNTTGWPIISTLYTQGLYPDLTSNKGDEDLAKMLNNIEDKKVCNTTSSGSLIHYFFGKRQEDETKCQYIHENKKKYEVLKMC